MLATNERENSITAMRIGYINDDASTIHSRIDNLMTAVDEFKKEHGDFGEKVPEIYSCLEQAIDFVENAMAEIELVTDAVREGSQ